MCADQTPKKHEKVRAGRVKTAKRKASIALEIECAHSGWRRLAGLETRLKKAARIISANLPKSLLCSGCATLLLTDDARIRKLNQEFRKKDAPTNVLSFPQYAPEDLKSAMREQASLFGAAIKGCQIPLYLGDIAMSWQTVKAEALRDGKTGIDHATHLVIHGILHLFGYDHMTPAEANKMEKLEIAIMKDLGLRNPYLAPHRQSS